MQKEKEKGEKAVEREKKKDEKTKKKRRNADESYKGTDSGDGTLRHKSTRSVTAPRNKGIKPLKYCEDSADEGDEYWDAVDDNFRGKGMSIGDTC